MGNIEAQFDTQDPAVLLTRDVVGQVHFSDVFPEVVVGDEDGWWKQTDFDSSLTVQARSRGFDGMYREIPIGERPWLADYGLVMLDKLVGEDVNRQANRFFGKPFEMLDKEEQFKFIATRGAVGAVANVAWRSDAATEGGIANGRDFYRAVTKNGLEISAVPISYLGDLAKRGEIAAMWRDPTEDNPKYPEGEQFRSSFQFPPDDREWVKHLVRVDKPNEAVPKDQRPGKFALPDRFGNMIAQLDNGGDFDQLAIGSMATLLVTRRDGNGNKTGQPDIPVPLRVGTDLKSAEAYELTVYGERHDTVKEGPRLVEVVSRVNDNPATSRDTAAYKLRELGINLATDEIQLVQ